MYKGISSHIICNGKNLGGGKGESGGSRITKGYPRRGSVYSPVPGRLFLSSFLQGCSHVSPLLHPHGTERLDITPANLPPWPAEVVSLSQSSFFASVAEGGCAVLDLSP